MTARRNLFIRSIVSVTGDIAITYAMASACVWVIQSAALGLFLSFLLWLLAVALSLAISQYALHPLVGFVLSDSKLDRGIDALSSLVDAAQSIAPALSSPLLRELRQYVARFTRAPAQ